MEVFGGLNLVYYSGFFGNAEESPVATVSLTSRASYRVMQPNATWHVRHCATYRTHSVLPFLSVLIGFHVIHPNTSVSPLSVIRYSIAIIAMQIEHSSHFVKTRPRNNYWFRPYAKFTLKGTSPTNHFCTNS